MIRTDGTWSHDDAPLYFLASDSERLADKRRMQRNTLVAVNEISLDKDLDLLIASAEQGDRLLIDSGVFNLSTSHAKKHGLTMDEALSIVPDAVDGFDELFSKYCAVIDRLQGRCWGYIEIDQGGKDNKRKTRQRLHDLGYKPIPVYHPINDGVEYFHELAESHDRLCLGNIVQANPSTRTKLLQMVWKMKRKYPHLWVHVLGLTAGPMMISTFMESCDSSRWLSQLRWVGIPEYSCLTAAHELGKEFRYRSDGDENSGYTKAYQCAGYIGAILGENWKVIKAEYDEAGIDVR